MIISKEDLIKMIEAIPYGYVNNVSINFQNEEIEEASDEFYLKME